MRVRYFTVLLVLLLLLFPGFTKSTTPVSAQDGAQIEVSYTVGEGFDFATRVLSDPWDMTQFTDISQWLNHTMIASYDMTNIQIYDGVFSAHTLGSYSEFFPLFPGYEPGILVGKIGAISPISSSRYQCFSMAMYASWPSADNNYFILTWGPDRVISHLVDPSYIWGQATGNKLVRNIWQLYQINLTTHPYLNGEPWTYQELWQLFRVAPSLQPDTQFFIDWVRLTDCTPVWVTFSGIPAGTYNLWIAHGSPERQILAAENFSPAVNGTYAWDAQGVEAGVFTYYVKTTTGTLVQQGTLNIEGTPIVGFNHPAPYTGIEYGTSNGNAWDIESSDVTYIACVNYAFTNGMLYLDTLPPTQLSGGCVGPGANESDPHVFLNTPDHGNLSAYRYLSFNMSQNGSISYPDKGMIVRLFWQLDRTGLTDCWYTSHAIPLEVGRHTYTIDMYDVRNGTPEARTPSDCPLVTWANQASVGPLVQFRIDPNENVLNWTFHQEIDWIRLTKVETIQQGHPAEIRLLLNKPVVELTSLDVYYTTDRNQPSQHPATRYTPPTINGPFLQFLPMALRLPVSNFYDPFIASLSADVVYWWNTTGVSPGTYYVCAVASDGYTTAAYCSQAPFQITAP